MRLIAIVLAAVLASSCGAGFYSAETDAEYTFPDGRVVRYRSNKVQQGFKAHYIDEAGRTITIEVDEAGTDRAAVAAAMQNNIMMGQIIDRLLERLDKLAAPAALAAGS